MSEILTAARKLQPGTICVFPFNRTATVAAIRLGRTYAYITWKEAGAVNSKVELGYEFHVWVSDMNVPEAAAYIARRSAEERVLMLLDYLENFSGFAVEATENPAEGTRVAYFCRLRSVRAAIRADGSLRLKDRGTRVHWAVDLDEDVPEELVKLTIDWAVKHSTDTAAGR